MCCHDTAYYLILKLYDEFSRQTRLESACIPAGLLHLEPDVQDDGVAETARIVAGQSVDHIVRPGLPVTLRAVQFLLPQDEIRYLPGQCAYMVTVP